MDILSTRSYKIIASSMMKLLLLACLLLLGACSPESTATLQVIPLEGGQDSGAMTHTPIPTRTPTPTSTPTPQPSASPTPYQNLDFSQVETGFGGFLTGWRYFITFEFPQTVQGEYILIVDRNKQYSCEVRPEYPQRLYCSGPLVVVYNWASFELYAAPEGATVEAASAAGEPLLSGRFFVPLLK